MAKIISVPPIPGVDGLFALLAFLDNKKAFQARLDELQDMHAQITALIEKVGKAEEIETMTTNAVVALETARDKLAEAGAKADALRAAAQREADAMRETIHDEREKWLAQRDSVRGDLDSRLAEVDRREAALKGAEDRASRLAATAASDLAAAKAMRDEAETRLSRMKAAIGSP